VEIIDVSVAVRPGMATYPGDPDVTLERFRSLAAGDVANVSRLAFGVHTGTHVDAPVHFVEGGAAAETLPLDVLAGPARVVDATHVAERLDADAVAGLELAERTLIKTRNSRLWELDTFAEEFVSFTGDGATVLVRRGVRLVGIDYLSIGDEEAHQVLLSAGVVVVEGLDLRRVEPGPYGLVCAPLKLVGSDGAPARALLVRDAAGAVMPGAPATR
jgi:arylformamidase